MRVDCNECGASLPIEASTRFVTCAKCTSRLAIKREESAIRTVLRADSDQDDAAGGAPMSSVGMPSAAGSTPQGESLLRIFIGALLIATDLFWWFTEPSLQSRPVRIVLLAGGAFLIVTGAYRAVRNMRARSHSG